MKYSAIDSKLFIENRSKFMAAMKPGAIAFFNANDEMPRNGDCNFIFRQNSDLFYLLNYYYVYFVFVYSYYLLPTLFYYQGFTMNSIL